MTRKININFKRLVFAVFAFSVALPMFGLGNAFAVECNGPTTIDELNGNQWLGNSSVAQITLCGNMTGTVGGRWGVNRIVTIDLNGYSITGNPTIRVSSGGGFGQQAGRLTIVGKGEVSGRFSDRVNGNNLILQGGTYTADPSKFVSGNYATYSLNGKNVVDEKGLKVYGEAPNQILEPEITDSNFIVSPMDPEEITIRKGQTAKITATLPAGSTSGVTFEADTDGVIEIDATGAITTVGTGRTWVTVTPTYDPTMAKGVYVNVYDIEPVSKPEGEQYEGEVDAAENLADVIDEGLVDDNGDATDKAKTTFGEYNAQDVAGKLQDVMHHGEVINTQIYKDEAYLTDSQRAEMVALMDGVSLDNTTFYEIDVDVYRGANYVGSLLEMDNPVRVFVAETTDPEAGYTRKYYMVSYHNGEPELLEEGVDFEIVDDKIYLLSNKFSVFALGFQDTLAPVVTNTTYSVKAPETGEAIEAEGGASASLSVAVMVAIAAVTLAGAAVIAKRK